MARSHGAMTNTGRPAPRRPNAEQDPRTVRTAPPGQQRFPQAPSQPQQNPGYPQQGGYPEQQAQNQYDPQAAYHYPQHPQAAPSAPRHAHNDPITQPPGSAEYAPYPTTQPPYPQQAPAAYGQPAAPRFPGQADPRMATNYDQWPAPAPHQDPRGYNLGSYMPADTQRPDVGFQRGVPGQIQPDPLQQQAEWVHAAQVPYGDALREQQPYPGAQLGFEQPHQAGALEATHSQEEGDYEYEEPRRGSWVLRIAGAIVVAVGLGYGLAQGYRMILGSSTDGTPPIVKGESAPAKTVPADPGGKQFAHTDSKVMGRLGEGAPPSDDTATTSDSYSGTRKVPTVTVGRDGAIVPPAEPAPAAASVSVPGLTVIDGFGGQYPGSATTSAVPAEPQKTPAANKPIVVNPPAKQAPAAKAKSAAPPPPSSDAASFDETPVAQKPPAAKKTAALADPETASGSGANGYVVVLASVPSSSQSRLDALKRFADMQQKYGTVLANKTPDVQEANLGDKGTFHRLLVGPPGSRAQASAVCTELKAAGYKDCWVTAY